MMIFTSKRERRLWTWTGVVIAGIYATLGLARTLAGVLRAENLLGVAFMLGMLLIGVAVVLVALKSRPKGMEIGVGLGIVAIYLFLFLRMAIPEERTHLIEYSVVALFIHMALTERANNGRKVPALSLLAILLSTLVGVVDELIQLFMPSRVFDPIDMLFNFLASLLAVAGILALTWAQRWRS